MLILGKSYYVPTTEKTPSFMFENDAVIESQSSDTINLRDLIKEDIKEEQSAKGLERKNHINTKK